MAARSVVNGVYGANGSNDSNGASGIYFSPERAVTRAEFAQMLVRALDIKLGDAPASLPFADVKADAWYAGAAAAAYQAGIVRGKADGTFGGQDRITRQDMAVMAYRALAASGQHLGTAAGNDAPAYADDRALADYARESVAALRAAGIVGGMPDGSFAPNGTANRAQAAVVLDRLLQLQGW